MSDLKQEKEELSRRLTNAVAVEIQRYATDHPDSRLEIGDVRDVISGILDYMDIADITGFGPWEQ